MLTGPILARGWKVAASTARFFPALEGRRIEQAWGGPIDVSPSHLPVVGEIEDGLHCAFGYTGHGVGPSYMVGRSLASLALGRDDAGPARLRLARASASSARAVSLHRRLDHPPRDPAQGGGARAR